ncbi:unnamed protein product [Fusarium graminearum]|nr:unnamed protein product [Fusarium graminearum]
MAAVTLIKVRILLDLQSAQNTTRAFNGTIPPEIVGLISSELISSAVASRPDILMSNIEHLSKLIKKVKHQIVKLYRSVNEYNSHFWRLMLCSPVSAASQRPEAYSTGTKEEACLTIEQCLASWVETPGAFQLMKDLMKLAEPKRTKPMLGIKSVAIIGGGASGTAAAAALKAEDYFEKIRVFERREAPGGTWLYDAIPPSPSPIQPGALPPKVNSQLEIPSKLPQTVPHNTQERFQGTPIYESLITTVPGIAMGFSDKRFPEGPFVSHDIPRMYLQNYYTLHNMEDVLVLNTTVEDLSKIATGGGRSCWRLTLRKHNVEQDVDEWWQEVFDAVIIANGQFSVPYVPEVEGLSDYIGKYPGRIMHSKYYRQPHPFKNKKVLIVGNALSGRDIAEEVLRVAQLPVHVSRRHKSIWEGPEPKLGVEWRPVIKEYVAETGQVIFDDGSFLDDIDHVIYCTGYKPSFPFWNVEANGGPLYDYDKAKLNDSFLHTFFRDHPTLGIIGFGETLAFRSYEYQAIALTRVLSGRNATPLSTAAEQEDWERSWAEHTKKEGFDFHTVDFRNGDLLKWYNDLSNIAGLPLCGKGRVPPAFTDETMRQLENILGSV